MDFLAFLLVCSLTRLLVYAKIKIVSKGVGDDCGITVTLPTASVKG